MRRAALALAIASSGALHLAAQQPDVAARLNGRVPAEVVPAVAGVAASAASRGLPVEPLIQKAIEGGAKGRPAQQVIAAVRALADQLGAASGALRSGGFDHPDADLVEGGAYALGAGLSVRQVQHLARASRPPYEPALTLRVAGTLKALGVPPKNTLDLVDLPSEVQAGVAHGETPAQAADGLARAAAHAPGSGPPGGVPPGQAKGHGNPHKP